MCQSRYENRTILKYSDYSVIVGLQGIETSYGPVIHGFVKFYLKSNIF